LFYKRRRIGADCRFGRNISLHDLQTLSTLLLQCGANINEINTVRKQISVLKGGKLLLKTNHARVVSLIISDVVDNDLSIIASGLTVADSSTILNAWSIIEKYHLAYKIPAAVFKFFQKIIHTKNFTAYKPSTVTNKLIATNAIALKAAAEKAKALGYTVKIVNAQLQGEASMQAAKFANKLLQHSAISIYVC